MQCKNFYIIIAVVDSIQKKLRDDSKLLIVRLCKLFGVLDMCNTMVICIYQLFADYLSDTIHF